MNKKKNNKKGFDNEKYVKTQIETIKKRIKLLLQIIILINSHIYILLIVINEKIKQIRNN